MTEDKQADKDVNNGNSKNVGGLVTIGLLFVLAVIAVLPSFLNKPQPARHIEGKTEVGAMSRAQRAYFEENNRLAKNLDELQLGIKSETDNYVYKIILQPDSQSAMSIAQAKREGFKSYVGLTYIAKIGNENLTISNLCETNKFLSKPPQMPQLPKNATKPEDIKCPSGFKSLL